MTSDYVTNLFLIPDTIYSTDTCGYIDAITFQMNWVYAISSGGSTRQRTDAANEQSFPEGTNDATT